MQFLGSVLAWVVVWILLWVLFVLYSWFGLCVIKNGDFIEILGIEAKNCFIWYDCGSVLFTYGGERVVRLY